MRLLSSLSVIYYYVCYIYMYTLLLLTISYLICHQTSSHLNPLQDENCDSNSRLVVDEDDNGKSQLKRMK